MSSDIKEVKTIIRGLLTSCAEEMTVGKLRRDYRTQEGHDIPFYDFKFHDVTSFLRSIPDVCQVCDNPYGPYAIVRLVESEKSAHISSLVMRQRSSAKPRRRPPSFGKVSYRIPQSTIRRAPSKPVHRSIKGELSFTKPVINGVSSNLNVLAPEFNATLSYPNKEVRDLPSSQVPKCDGVVGEENSEDTFLCSASHNEEVPAVIDEADLKIHLHNVITNHEALYISFGELKESVNLSLSLMRCNISVDIDKIKSTLRLLPEFEINGGSVCCIPSHNQIYESPEKKIQLEQEELLFPSGSSESNDRVQRLERNLYSMMKDYSNGILISELIQNYKMRFAAPLNLQILGCKTAEELVDKMSSIFSCERTENGDIKLYPAWLPKSHRNDPIPKKTFLTPLIKRNIQWLMENYPDGMPSKDFKEKYKDTFYGEVDITEMGFSTYTDFFCCLEREGVLQICISDSETWLLPKSNPIEIPVIKDPLPPISPETEEDIVQLKSKFPNDVMGPDENVEQLKIPSWVLPNSIIEVRVQDVSNPHNFWVSLVGEKYYAALEHLMDDLQAFYCSHSYSYRMAAELVRKGQNCVCLFNGEWNRARVTRLVDSNKVELFYYDYGTPSVVPVDSLCFLHSSFTKLPAQAIRGVLANLSPKGDTWSKESATRFLTLIYQRPLIGIVHNVDTQNNVLSLFLCDTNGKEDVYIHSVLEKEGYAVGSIFNTAEPFVQENLTDFKTEDLNINVFEEVGFETNFVEETGCFINEEEITFPITQEACSSSISKILGCPMSTGEDVTNSVSNNFKSTGEDVPSISNNFKSSGEDVTTSFFNNFMDVTLNAPDEVCDVKSESIEKCKSNISTHFDAMSSETEPHVSKLAPPPGFSRTSNKGDFNDNFNRNQTLGKCAIGSEGMRQPQKGDRVEMSSEHPNYSSKCVNSGVNANFSNGFETHPGYAKPGYLGSNTSSFPSHVDFQPPYIPYNLSASLPVLPVPLPSILNPLDLYSAYCYEHIRQQAWMQGALIRQQLTAAMLPPLANGLILTQNQDLRPSQKYVNNEMHISELPSLPLKNKNNPKVTSYASSIATQTEGDGNLSLLNNVSTTSSPSISSEACDSSLTRREQINGLEALSSVAVQTPCNENPTILPANSSRSPSLSSDVCEVQSNSAVSVEKSDSRTYMLQPSPYTLHKKRDSVSAESTSNKSSLENSETVNPEKFDTITLVPFSRGISAEIESAFHTDCADSHENYFKNPAYPNKNSSSGINPCSNRLNIRKTERTGSVAHQDEVCSEGGIESCEESDPFFSDTEANNENVKYVDVVLKPISSFSPESIALSSQQKVQDKESVTYVAQTISEDKHIPEVPSISKCNGVTNSYSTSMGHKTVSSELLESLMNVHIKEEKSSVSTNNIENLSETEVLDNSKHFNHKKGNPSYGSEPTPNTRTRVTLEENGGNINKQLTSDAQVLNHKLSDPSRMKMTNNIFAHKRLPVSSNPLQITKINSISDVMLPKKETSSETWSTTWSTENLAHPVAPKTDAKHSISGPNSSRKNGSIRYCDNSSFSRDGKRQFVRKTKLLDHEMHLINLDGRPYVPTDEIVRNFTSFNGHHVVLKILDARKIEINFLELCRKRRPDIFDHLDKTDIKYVSRGPTGNILGSLHTVPLRSIPYMLKALNKESPTIASAVQEQMNNFDPNDLYWQGH